MSKRKQKQEFRDRSQSPFRWFFPSYVIGRIQKWRKRRRSSLPLFRRVLQTFVALLALPFRVLRFTLLQLAAAFMHSWRSARWRTLWFGMPFGLVAVGSLFLVLACRASQRPSLIAAEYSEAARRAKSRQDFEAATLWYERVLELRNGHDFETMYHLAQLADELGNPSRVDAILRTLAPLDDATYGEAHLWQAQRIAARGEQRELEVDELRQINTHLLYAVKLDPENAEAHALLGAYYMNIQRYQLAVQHLTIAVRQQPDLYLALARAHTLMGNNSQAAQYGDRALAYFREVAAANPRNIGARLNWADAALFMEDFRNAAAILNEGLSLSDENAYRQALVRVYIAWADSMKENTLAARRERLKLIQTGVEIFPNDMELFHRMGATLRDDPELSETAREFLVARIARGESVMLAHLLLGTYEGERGNYNDAIKHLELAFKLNPDAPIIANNLAWYLLQSESIDLQQAYAMVSALAERWPWMGAIHDTRGQILAKMGRWQDAFTELELALPATGGTVATHHCLVEVCDQLGLNDLADEHRRILAQMTGKKD